MADSSLASRSRRNKPSPSKQEPPAAGRKLGSRSPVRKARRTGRTLRSQSRETAGDGSVSVVVGVSGRGVRQVSTESVGSGQDSDAKGRRRRGNGRALRSRTGVGDLSAVAEDQPVEHLNPERGVLHEGNRQDAEEAGADALVDAGTAETDEDGPRDAPESPTAFSTISGTTARTSHSAQELADIDADFILEVLPTLSDTSSKLLSVLAPAGATTEEISNITKGLLLPGSKVSRRVKFQESSFQSARGEFGSDLYIDLSIIGRALLGVRLTKDIGTGPWSPDPLLQKANLATFATRMLVDQRGSQDLWAAVALLDSKFPAPFLSTLEPPPGSAIGGSRLLKQTFDLALNLRTQLMLMILTQHAERPNYDPDAILAYVFFEGRDNVKGWSVPGLGGGGTQLSGELEKLVLERIQRIRRSFAEPSESHFVAGEPAEMPAELKRLEEIFPWVDFLSEVVSWTNLRLEEIERQVAELGGTSKIVLALREEMDRRRNERSREIENDEVGEEGKADEGAPGRERPIDLTFEQPAWKPQRSSDQESVAGGLLPTTEKAPKVPGLSFNNPAGIAYFKKREAARRSIQERKSPALYPSLPQTADTQTMSVAGPSRQNQTAIPANKADTMADSQDEDDWRPPYNEDEEEDDTGPPAVVPSSEPPPSSAPVAILKRYIRHQREKNKENVKLREANEETPRPKKSFIDPQVGAKRVGFSEDLEDSPPTSYQKPNAVDKGKKRARDVEEQVEGESEDDDFEIDSRPVKESRRKRRRTKPQTDRITVPIQPSLSPEQGQPSQSRQRNSQNSIRASQQRRSLKRQPEIEEALSSQFHGSSDTSSDEDEVEADAKPRDINYQYINTLAKRSVALKTRKVQVRRAWTEQEVSRFIELIEEHGPSWARIQQAEDPLLVGRSQVNLKDKARNMKFDFVKAQQEIPVGFDAVRLNRNQLNMLDEMGIEYDQ
ncbi:hypothetical protein GP486_005060 [Trichoglossum hirsutum]|uniref:Myb-like domain-containing protein n=1 Tax=Trichoglossum hirsutum TaxID=265104 RepID=A0A9P8RMX9_9PEZI|nr:hypothetical protein GP486_005060 [Trichoglossum hirsutum]